MNHPLLYLEHLSDHDFDLIARTAGAGDQTRSLRVRLADAPELLDGMLADPRLFDALFGPRKAEIGPRVTPFLTFGVLVNRTAHDLETESYVPEWTAPNRRVPVFDVASLRGFLDEGTRRFFLIEFLASFTRVASGGMWVRTRKGYRRRRYSELDPVRFAELVDRLPPEHRPGGYRRLGDVALFLSGVFPDHTARHPLGELDRERLARSAGVDTVEMAPHGDDLQFHEAVGAGWYRRAVDAAAATVGVGPEFLLDVADRFHHARRILNLVADRYLFRIESGLMGPAG